MSEQNTKSILEQETKAWAEIPRIRPPWIAQKHGKTIAPQMDQKSNNSLTEEQVLQPRFDPVIISTAKPIGGRKDSGHGQSDEPSGKKANLPSNFARIT
jgi:hypothetical protein